MGTLISNTCWPVRFPTKWLLLFVFAMLLGVCFRLTQPRPNLQANIVVWIKYEGDADYTRTRANVYFGHTPEDIPKTQPLRVYKNGRALRTQTAGGLIDFMVQPLSDAGKEEGTPTLCQVKWPLQKNVDVPLYVEHSYRRPKR